jgi:soluble lytic murein transglycosylase
MPRVPEVSLPRATAQTSPGVAINDQVANADIGVANARQMQRLGEATSNLGQNVGNIAFQMQEQANRVRVNDAVNQAKELDMRLTYDKDQGYQNLRGKDAFTRPDGMSLVDEYGDKFDKETAAIEQSLGNDAQRRAFQEQRAALSGRMRAQLAAHEATQFREYSLSVAEGGIANDTQEIGMRYNDPEVVDRNTESIRARVYELGQLNGKSAEWIEARQREATSKAHVTAISAALDNNDAAYADGYTKRYKDQLDAADYLKVQGLVTKEVDAKMALDATQVVMAEKVLPRLQTTELDRAFNILLGSESGSKQFGGPGSVAGAGQPTTSPKGAIGIAQVMPATGPEAAKLAGMKWDEQRYRNDPTYNAALGKAYFSQQIKEFGDLGLAYAAYNAGPGATRAAMKKAEAAGDPNTWINYVPKETQDYVTKNLGAMAAGAGKNAKPTLLEVQQAVREQVGTNSPQRLKLALEEAERQYTVAEKAVKDQEDAVVSDAMTMLIQNGGSYASLPVDVRGALPVDKVASVMDFAKKIGTGEQVVTNDDLFIKLQDPKVLRDTNLATIRNELSTEDFKKFAERQGRIRSGDEASDYTRLRSTTRVMDDYLLQADLDPKDKNDAPRVAQLWRTLEDNVAMRENAKSSKLTPEEIEKEIAGLFTKVSVYGEKSWWGTPAASEKNIAELGATDRIVIPEVYRTELLKSFEAKGILTPSEKQLQTAYLMWQRTK